MIARLDNLRKSATVFRHLTGLTVAAFDWCFGDSPNGSEPVYEGIEQFCVVIVAP